MPRLNLPPTKSNLLLLRRQLAVAEEGYDLLEQKRQILLLELRQRLEPALAAEEQVRARCQTARSHLCEATLDNGSAALDRAALGTTDPYQVTTTDQRVVGLRLPRVILRSIPRRHPGAPTSRWAATLATRGAFLELLPLLASLAERSTAVFRLARELRRTQRRCNALSKIFIPDRREAAARIATTLEERERESLAVLKLIRDQSQRDR
ncbi:MAG: V-type ATP synthase subunit D [Verrucomicrobiales bacterium]|nr:V-type ATP synthase subunit D [Verrucomicrobiales bacterium]